MNLDELWTSLSSAFPGLVAKLLAAVPVALIVLLAAFALNLAVRRALLLLAHRTSLTAQEISPLQNIVSWLIRIVASIAVLGVFGFQLGGLWAMLSTILAMIAIGFVAVWSILSNTSATVLILILRPFGIGDEVELSSENVKGRVVDLNFFFTTVAVDATTVFRVPNNLFFQKCLKRTAGPAHITLAQQLSSPLPADIPLPPLTPSPTKDVTPASEDFAAKAIPATFGGGGGRPNSK